jgi:transketolase
MAESAVRHDDLANAVRALSMDAVEAAKSGHPGLPLGMADVATVLFQRHLKFDAQQPLWPDRDRFVLSAGHGSMLLYALLHLCGYPDMTIDELKRFRQLGSRTAGHPEYGYAYGIETTTGPLGQGIATAVGMALAERLLAARYGDGIVDHRTYVLASDGDLMEGISHEACSLAGHLGLHKMIVLFDDNGITLDGPADWSVSDDQIKRFEAYGWATRRVDGHDPEAVDAAIAEARRETARPSLIACRTIIGKGAPTKQGTAASHGAPLGAKEIEGAREAMGWTHAAFVLPDEVTEAWHAVGRRGADAAAAWKERLGALPGEQRAEFERALAGELPEGVVGAIEAHKRKVSAERPSWATRKASQEALEVLTAAVPEMIGGSADLTHSNNTKTKVTEPVSKAGFKGRYINYGVREHGMMAAMNGIALHKGLIPYGGTFLIFSDYCRPAIRLGALMHQRVVFVGTHDSIGLGEDGPTHQPVEQLAALRAIPNLLVFRPADGVEAAECWLLAVQNDKGPSAMALSRQNLPTVRTEHTAENLCARGAYVLAGGEGKRQATILSTGSEIQIAMAARELLAKDGVEAAVVSMPCWQLFDKQDPGYRASVLGSGPRVAVEAASPFGWARYLGDEEHFVGMRSFGASGPIDEVYKHFGITAEAVADKVRGLLA